MIPYSGDWWLLSPHNRQPIYSQVVFFFCFIFLLYWDRAVRSARLLFIIHCQFSFLSTDLNVFEQGFWKDLQQQALSLGEPSFLAVLKKTALLSEADGTVVNYTYNLRRWVEFARVKGLHVFPASVIDVSLFIAHLSTTCKSSSVIQSSYCALKWVHDLAGVPNPMGNTFLKNLIEGAKREHAKPVSKKSTSFQRCP